MARSSSPTPSTKKPISSTPARLANPSENTPLLSHGTPPRSPAPSQDQFRVNKHRRESLAVGKVDGHGGIRSSEPYYASNLMKFLFALLMLCLFLCIGAVILLFVNLTFDLAMYLPPNRGEGFLPIWWLICASVIIVTSLARFTTPSALLRLSQLLSLFLLSLSLILVLSIQYLRRTEGLLASLALSLSIFGVCVSWLVNKQGQKIFDQIWNLVCCGGGINNVELGGANKNRAGTNHALQFSNGEKFLRGVGFFLAWTITNGINALLVLLLISLLTTASPLTRDTHGAFQNTTENFSINSTLYNVQPYNSWPYKLSLTCITSNITVTTERYKNGGLTVLFEPHRGEVSFPPTPSTEWLYEMVDSGDIRKACFYDRPGYGLSDVAPTSEFSHISQAFHQALEKSGETGPFLLIGSGYGGLLQRVFASRHSDQVHAIIYVDSESANTISSFPPGIESNLQLFTSRIKNILIPSIISPFSRLFPFPPVPAPPTPWRATLQETYLIHSRQGGNFQTLIKTLPSYPRSVPTIVLSSGERVANYPGWESNQRNIAQKLTKNKEDGEDEDGEGLRYWKIVDSVGHDICADGEDGKKACKDAVLDLIGDF